MSKICLFGASGHGKVVKDVALSQSKVIEAFIDDKPKSKLLDGISVVPSGDMTLYKANKFVISIGENKIRKAISKKINNAFVILIHRAAIISPTVNIQEGTVVMAGAIINSDTIIGKHVIVNTSAIIEHDCIIKDFVHISPNATITGNVIISEGTHVGANATIIPNLKIGKWVTIGAGAVVIEDVPDYAVVVGNPGKIIKYNKK